MIHHGDCLDAMAAMEPESVDAIVTDPPYGLEFMGKEWDKLNSEKSGNAALMPTGSRAYKDDGRDSVGGRLSRRAAPPAPQKNWRCRACGRLRVDKEPYRCKCERPDWDARTREFGWDMQAWHQQWAEAAYRVAKPSAYLLAFGGTRTVHRMTVALEDAGWIIRDMLVWAYASGFPKSKASLKPAWEPIVMARKPGPLRELAIDACRIGIDPMQEGNNFDRAGKTYSGEAPRYQGIYAGGEVGGDPTSTFYKGGGRWPANVILTANDDGSAIFDGGWEGVVGGGESASGGNINGRPVTGYSKGWADERWFDGYSDTGTYSRYFLIPKADRADREPVLRPEWAEPGKRASNHPTVKPTELMRHLVRLVTPPGGTVLDPFLGSGTTGIAAEMEGFAWVGIEREEEYVRIAEARLNGTQRGLGLSA